MRLEVLAIGDELLDGRVVEANGARLGRRLAARGLTLAAITVVPDDRARIIASCREIAARGTGLCVVSGGLGPTSDDLTAEALAEAAGVPLELDEAALARIAERLAARGRPLTDNQRRQALRPRGAALLANALGTAPGFALTLDGCRFVSLPGVPRELEAMVEAHVLPLLPAPAVERVVFSTFGLIEAEVDARLTPAREAHPAVRFAFQVKFPEVYVQLTGADGTLGPAAAVCRAALGEHLVAEPPAPFAEVVLAELRARQASLAVAESCTGGLVCELLTDVPGCSDVLRLGVVAYANEAKQALLGVPAALLAAHGAVSEPVALAMAEGAARAAGATYAVATTGVAGPGGGTPDKPVGTVYVAAVAPGWQACRRLQLPFDRAGNRRMAAYAALELLRRRCRGSGEQGGAGGVR